MPISPIVLQRRHAELGRIRLGAKEQTSNGRTRPAKLAAFRFTSPSERYITDLAALYGGDPKPWDNNGKAEFEVYTTATVIPVIAVKGGLSQWMETWSGGGCVHRCDGERNVEGNLCDPDDPKHTEAKPTTRLSVMLPELEAVGVFRMETHGWNAAAEIPAVAELAQFVGDLVPANLHLVERRSVRDGQTSRFVVPVLDLQIGTARLKEIVAQKSGTAAELTGAPVEQRAIGAGPAAAEGGVQLPTLDDIKGASTRDAVVNIWKFLKGHDALTDELDAACADRVAELEAPAQQTQQQGQQQGSAHGEEPVDAELVDDGDQAKPEQDANGVWQEVLSVAGGLGMGMKDVTSDFEQRYALSPTTASAGELAAYLEVLKTEGRAA